VNIKRSHGYFISLMDLQKFINELSVTEVPKTYLPPIEYSSTVSTSPEQIVDLLKQINKAKDRKCEHMVLYYAYVIGKIIEEETHYLTRKACTHLLTNHYRRVTKRLTCLFDNDRTPLLLSCKHFTLTNIAKLSSKEFKRILVAAEEASTNRFLALYNQEKSNEVTDEDNSPEDLESLERENCNPESQE
jgi:hypothetical protein